MDAMVPPEEIQTIVDKTANFVARLGADFERRIFANEKNNPKFSFLKAEDQYFPFYQKRIKDFREELGPEAAPYTEPAPPEPENEPKQIEQPSLKEDKPPVVREMETITEAPKMGVSYLSQRIFAVARKNKSKEIDTPPPEVFTLELPPEIAAVDLDVIKLTAQFVAKNGHQFQVGLMNREHKNPQFDFLKQNHVYHNYYLGLVESYTRVILPPRGIVERLKSDVVDKQVILDRMIAKYEWERQQEKLRRQQEEQANQEQIANALIDWHDFVIVETIDFFEDEEEVAPQPMDHYQPAPVPAVEQMEMDDVEMEVEETVPVKAPPKPPAPVARPKAPVCPKCNQEVPAEHMEEHMRVEHDPKYRIQKQVLASKSQPTEEKPPTPAPKVEPPKPKSEDKPPEPATTVAPPAAYAPPGVRPGILPPPPGIVPVGATSEPQSKKQKTEALKPLVPEQEFLARNKGPVTVRFQIAKDHEKMGGQTISLTLDLTTTVAVVKDKLAEQVGVTGNKQKLKGDGLPFLKDNQTLASYNITNGSSLQLGFKTRGGKK